MEFRYVVFLFHNFCSADKPHYKVIDMNDGLYPKCGVIIGGSNDESWAHVLGRAAVMIEGCTPAKLSQDESAPTDKSVATKTIVRGDYE